MTVLNWRLPPYETLWAGYVGRRRPDFYAAKDPVDGLRWWKPGQDGVFAAQGLDEVTGTASSS